MLPKNVAVIGSTGSIGRQALGVIASLPEKLQVVALAAGANAEVMVHQAQQFRPSVVALQDPLAAQEVLNSVGGKGIKVEAGREGVLSVASYQKADIVLIATSGLSGLEPTMAAIQAGKSVALANKESLVTAGEIIAKLCREREAQILPVDSEHSAIFQCLNKDSGPVETLFLTASGGPFRLFNSEQLASVTPEKALQHPRWKMGPKVTIDSATMMNKGLEVMEAHWLFDIEYKRIKVLLHPQSIVHSLVAFADGALLAQLGCPDMRVPIQFALSWPERWSNQSLPRLSTGDLMELNFSEVPAGSFPCFDLALEAAARGASYPVALVAADEVAVAAFLDGYLPFTAIACLVEEVLANHKPQKIETLDELFALDHEIRLIANKLAKQLSTGFRRRAVWHC